MVDVPRGLDRITCPVLLLHGTADPLISGQAPRFLALVPHPRMRWLAGLSHLPISDDPALVGRLIRQFVDDAERARSRGGDLTAARSRISCGRAAHAPALPPETGLRYGINSRSSAAGRRQPLTRPVF
jgi:hypothetical protein